MKPVFLYLHGSVTKATIKKLEDGGYLAISVSSFESVRVAEPIIIGHGAIVAKAAFEALSTCSWSGPLESFGKRVAVALSKQ